MKIGGFGRIADYEKIKAAGFDYAELDLPEIEELSEEAFEALCEKVKQEDFPVLTGARALPIATPWFFTEQFSLEEYRDYRFHIRQSCIGMALGLPACLAVGAMTAIF